MRKWWGRPATVATVAVLVGVAARTWAFAAGHALWLDEILLTNGIVGTPLGELMTAPLPYDQVAPRAFLLVERGAVALGGPSEWMLRLFPWLAALASVVLFRRLAARVGSGWTVPLAVLLFALAAPLVGFAGMVKQYASDVAIAIALTLVALELRTTAMPPRRLVLIGLLGFVAVAFSQAAVPMMAGLGVATAVVLLVVPMLATRSALPPTDTEHNRTMLAHLQRHRRPGDLVYVFPLQRIGTTYYGPEYGLHPGEWTSAVCAPGDARASLRDVDRFRGVPRLWVLSAAARPFRVNHELVGRYLATIGERRDQLSRPSRVMGRVDLELWDLSASRHSQASAETFAVPPFNGPPARCREWSQPDPRPDL